MQPPKNLLVRGVNWLGDAIMTTPALRRLREAYPEAQITLLGPQKLSQLWLHHPDVNRVLSIKPGERMFSVVRRLRAEHFDAAIIFPNSPRSAFESFLAGIPNRIGTNTVWRKLLLTRAVAEPVNIKLMRKRTPREIRGLISNTSGAATREYSLTDHHIYHYLRIAEAAGASAKPCPPRINVAAEEVAELKRKWRLDETPSLPWFGINPGAAYGPAKRWPAENFSSVAKAVSNELDCGWVIFGSETDAETATMIAREIASAQRAGAAQVLNMAGKTSLRELCVWLRACSLLLTNDSGPMHVAAALDTPVIVPFGSTSPELTGPGLPGDRTHILLTTSAPCAPCFLPECPIDFRCMGEHTVQKVTAAVLEVAMRSAQRNKICP
ncbi:MAG TPA: lipopolysaccharide heptosyltransferase II [Verrucomicrobiae bacterium]